MTRKHTTLSVPMSTGGGAWFTATISATKFALMPMMVMREMASMARTTVKVAPRAPKFAPCILAVGVGFGVGGCFGFLDSEIFSR